MENTDNNKKEAKSVENLERVENVEKWLAIRNEWERRAKTDKSRHRHLESRYFIERRRGYLQRFFECGFIACSCRNLYVFLQFRSDILPNALYTVDYHRQNDD